MNEALIIVAVVAVVAIVVFVVKGRGRPSTEAVEERPAVSAAPEPVSARPEPVSAAAEAEPVVEVVKAPPPEPPKPKPSEGELKARVEASLGESKQMLDGLRAQESEGMAQQIGAGTLEIMAEGLEEVQALADKKQWSQAKDKADALEAQFRLLLQTTSREKPS